MAEQHRGAATPSAEAHWAARCHRTTAIRRKIDIAISFGAAIAQFGKGFGYRHFSRLLCLSGCGHAAAGSWQHRDRPRNQKSQNGSKGACTRHSERNIRWSLDPVK